METLGRFWELVVEVWENGAFGIDLGQIAVAIAILLVAMVLRRLFTRFVIHQILRLTKNTETDIDDALATALEGPLRFVPLVIGFFIASEYLTLGEELQQIVDGITQTLVLFNIFWAFYRAVDPLSTLLATAESVLSREAIDWMVKALKVVIVALGATAALESWGIEVGPLIAGLGLFGVAVALGAQDLFKNLIAGVFVISEGRFQNGDWVLVDGVVEGTVEGIGFRTTLIRRFDKAPVYVPNSALSDNAVTNFTRMTHRRIYWKIGLEYRASVEQLKTITDDIRGYILGNDEFAHPPEVSTFVHVDAFNDSSIDVMVYCFTRTTDWGEWLEIKERFAMKIKEIVEGHGAGFAFPSQSVYVEMLPDAPAPFGDTPA